MSLLGVKYKYNHYLCILLSIYIPYMKDLVQLLLKIVPPYKRLVFLSFLTNILSTILSLFSFAVIIPILQILFKINEASYTLMSYSAGSIKEVFINNFYYYVTHIIEQYGGGSALLILGLLLVVMTGFKTGMAYLSSYYLISLRSNMLCDLRTSMYNKVIRLHIGFFSGTRKGDIMSRMAGDIGEVENSIMSSLELVFKNPVMIIVYLGTMFMLSWQLTLFVLMLLPISGYIMGKAGKKLKYNSGIAQALGGTSLSIIDETISGLRIIKAFNAESIMEERYDKLAQTIRRMTNSIGRRQTLAHPLSELLGTLTIAIVLWFGGSLIITDASPIDGATFIYYLIIFYSIINPAKALTQGIYAVQRGLAALERVDVILAAENNIKNPLHPTPLKGFKSQIELRDVWFKYEDKWVLKGINLTIEKGKKIALVGQSGSGKSTLVDLVPRFYDIQKGEILLDGVSIKDYMVADLRSLMGNVNQEAILFNDTFYNNISFGIENATAEMVEHAARVANAHDFIMETADGYQTNIGDRGGKLSGGQRQRISIARAILKNPAILILDEATSALDTESEKLVQDALENLMKDRTSLVVAHRLSTIKNADEICVLHDGEIVERGSHAGLYSQEGIYHKLCNMQEVIRK